jgi:hypothetical protein
MTLQKDLSQLSNQELAQIAGIQLPPQGDVIGRGPQKDLSQLANEELAKIAGVQLQPQEGIVERGLGAVADIGAGGVAGLEQIGLGALQRINELGGEGAASVFRNVLPLIRPDLSAQLSQITPQDVQAATAQRAGAIEQEAQERGLPFQIGQVAGQVAPVLGIGAGVAPAAGLAGVGQLAGIGARAGVASGLLTPTKATSVEESSIEAVQNAILSGGIGAAGGAAFGGIAKALPAAAPAIASSLTKGKDAITQSITKSFGINKQAAQEILDEDIAISLAAISDRPAFKLVDRFLAKFPGSAGIVKKNTDQVINKIMTNLDAVGSKSSQSIQEAGGIIQKGGENFVGRFRDTSDKLYKLFEKTIPDNKKFNVSNVTGIVDDVKLENTNTPSILDALQRTSAFKTIKGISDDATDGALDFRSIKRHRTQIGDMLSKPQLLPGDDERLLRRTYGALSETMRKAASEQSPRSLQLFERANSFYAKGADRIENTLQKVLNSQTPEKIFEAARSGSKIGGTRINKIMKSLTPDEREVIRGTFIKQLGSPTPGQAGVEETFSPRRFLTAYNPSNVPGSSGLSKEAKDAIFGKSTSQRKALDKIANISDRISQIDRFGNPSGTAQVGATGALLVGSFIDLGSALAAVGGSNISARLLNNSPFVRWLAKNAVTKDTKPGAIVNALNELGVLAKNNPDIASDIAKYVTLLKASTVDNLGRGEQ